METSAQHSHSASRKPGWEAVARSTFLAGDRSRVNIPAGVQNGEELRLPGQGEALWQGGPVGDLILTVSIPPVNPNSSPSNPGFYQHDPDLANLATEIGSTPSFAAPASTPDYRPGSSSNIPPTSYSPYSPPPAPTQATYTRPAQSGDNYPYQQQQQGQEPMVLPQAQDQTSYANPAPPPYPSYPQAGQQGGSGQTTHRLPPPLTPPGGATCRPPLSA